MKIRGNCTMNTNMFKKAGLLFLIGVMSITVSWGAQSEFTPRITDVTVFKDGHAMVMSKGTVKPDNGWCRTREVPTPIMGTFWTFVEEKETQIDFLKSGFVATEKERPFFSLDEIISANKGKKLPLSNSPEPQIRFLILALSWDSPGMHHRHHRLLL